MKKVFHRSWQKDLERENGKRQGEGNKLRNYTDVIN